MSAPSTYPLRVFAPGASAVFADVLPADAPEHSEATVVPLGRSGDVWHGTVPEGSRYALRAEGGGPRFDGRRSLVDPSATAVWFSAEHSRDDARPPAPANHGRAPQAIAAPWPPARPPRRTERPWVVYEAHVRGMTRLRDHARPGTFAAFVDELARLAELGVSVLELLPVHQFDPDEGNYWGYMPLVFGAVHRQYAARRSVPADRARRLRGRRPRPRHRGVGRRRRQPHHRGARGRPDLLAARPREREYYVHEDGATASDGAPPISTTRAPATSSTPAPGGAALIMEALDRFADLGVDGFRFDLAAVLARDADFVRRIGDWASDAASGSSPSRGTWPATCSAPTSPTLAGCSGTASSATTCVASCAANPGMVPSVMRRAGGQPRPVRPSR
jgi:isoamylase